MRNSTAYFAGVATVFTATALGFGGAMIATNATAPRSPAEPTRLERSVVSPAQTSSTPDTRTGTTAEPSEMPQSLPLASPETTPAQLQQPPQQPASSSASQPTRAVSTVPPASTLPASAAEQSAADSQANMPRNAFVRGSDADVRKYVRKRERRWARRHSREDDVTTEQVSNSADQNKQSLIPSQSPLASSSQMAPQGQVQPGQQIKTTDQISARVDDGDTKVRHKHDRHWGRGYSRNDDEGIRGEDRGRSFEVRETPREEGPHVFFDMPRWRPVFSDSNDD